MTDRADRSAISRAVAKAIAYHDCGKPEHSDGRMGRCPPAGVTAMTDAEQIALFLAERGATRIPAGVGKLGHFRARDWRRAARSTERIDADREQQRLIDERHTVLDHLGRPRVRNGLGEWIA